MLAPPKPLKSRHRHFARPINPSEKCRTSGNREIASRDHVIRHRCHNRLCVNPRHLQIGSQQDNKHDDWAHWAYGTDPDYL